MFIVLSCLKPSSLSTSWFSFCTFNSCICHFPLLCLCFMFSAFLLIFFYCYLSYSFLHRFFLCYSLLLFQLSSPVIFHRWSIHLVIIAVCLSSFFFLSHQLVFLFFEHCLHESSSCFSCVNLASCRFFSLVHLSSFPLLCSSFFFQLLVLHPFQLQYLVLGLSFFPLCFLLLPSKLWSLHLLNQISCLIYKRWLIKYSDYLQIWKLI